MNEITDLLIGISMLAAVAVVLMPGYCILLWFLREKRRGMVVVEKWSRVAVTLVPTEPFSRQLVFRYALIDCGEDMPAEKISATCTAHPIKITVDYQRNLAVQYAKILTREEASRISVEYVIVED